MRIRKIEDVYVVESSFSEKDTLKAAGLWWHPGMERCDRAGCRACRAGLEKSWYTLDRVVASRLIEFSSDDATRDDLAGVKASQEASRASDASIEVPAPAGLAYLPFQRAGIQYLLNHPATLLADEMGCVEEDALINVNRGGKGFRISLRDAFLRLHGKSRGNWNWDPKIQTYCRALCDGELRQHAVRNILYRGLRAVVRLTLASGKTLRLTPDHEVARPNGTWTAAERLRAGDPVLTNGGTAGHGGKIIFVPTVDTVVSVEPAGFSRVYDIVMKAPHRNFVANGVIVHNCGKTVEVVGLVNSDPSLRKILVICPATLRINWRNELVRWLVRPATIRVVEGREIPELEDEIVVVNYEKLTGPLGEPLRQALLAREWDLVAADECHYLKSSNAQRTVVILGRGAGRGHDAVVGLLSRGRRQVLLSGTPILNKPKEAWTLVHALAPGAFTSFFSFAKRYCDAKQNRWGWDFDGASHLDELQEKMRGLFMCRRLKKDVLKELPAKRRQIIVLPADRGGRAVTAEMTAWAKREAALRDLRDQADLFHAEGDEAAYKKAVAALRKGMQAAFEEISRLRHETALAKVPAVLAWVKEALEETPKLVVFAHHHDVVKAIAKEYGNEAVVLTGETPMNARQALVDNFQVNPDIKLFIGSITAAGVGLTLTAASTVVFAELDWVPANLTQAEDRLHRIGQDQPVLVVHLVLDHSLDARMAELVVEKQTIMDAALDDAYERSIPVLPAAVRGARPSKYPAATSTARAAALNGLRLLSGVCDGAVARDDAGFNGLDSKIGKSLAKLPSLTDGQVWLACKILPKYHSQLPAGILEALK